jgi:hypothetical protein
MIEIIKNNAKYKNKNDQSFRLINMTMQIKKFNMDSHKIPYE